MGAPPRNNVEPCSVLLIEDEPLISLDLYDSLIEAGYQVLGPAITVAGAKFLLQQQTPQFAIVDVLLRDGPCSEIAHQLRRTGVPFIIHSGYGHYSTEIDGFSDVPWLPKPSSPTELIAMLEALSKSTGADPRADLMRIRRSSTASDDLTVS